MKVLAGVGVVAMPMRLAFQCNRNEAHLTVRDAALCNYAIGEVSHSLGFSTKYCHFETAFMVEMHMQRCDISDVKRCTNALRDNATSLASASADQGALSF